MQSGSDSEVQQFNTSKEIQGTEAQAKEQVLRDLYTVIMSRKANPSAESYTAYLFREGINKILKKVGEEAAEVIIAAKDQEKGPLVYEVADLFYHLLVLLAEKDIDPEEVLAELAARRGNPPHR
jgi:phosphoribosyl-ATP pyrophosphohydrolase